MGCTLHETFIEYSSEALWAEYARKSTPKGENKVANCQSFVESAKTYNLMKIKMSCTMNKFHSHRPFCVAKLPLDSISSDLH